MQKLSLKQTAQQKLAPRQIQFINLLQASNANLQTRIEKELIENPILVKEEEDNQQEVVSAKTTTIGGSTIMTTQTPFRNRSKKDFSKDWLQNQSAEAPSFRENLWQQIQFLSLDRSEQRIAKYLIGSLTAQGYLTRPLPWIVTEMAVIHHQETNLAAVEKVLKILQGMGPPGIAARNLQEALLLQLEDQKPTETTRRAIRVVADHFEAFQKKHYGKIAEKCNLAPPELQKALQIIRKLHPYPVAPTSEKDFSGILEPDFVVTPSQGKLQIALVERRLPKLRISSEYRALLQKHKHEKTTHSQEIVQFVQSKIHQAKHFMKAIEQRKQTLIKIMKALVALQKPFFQTGDPMKLAPIFLRNIAEQIDMDVSTISRAISQKALQTPWGVYPLKYFFSRAVPTKEGKQVSNHLVKETLARLIDGEDKKAPHTDEVLASMLRQKGFFIARRTITKYREQLDILPARLRKEWR